MYDVVVFVYWITAGTLFGNGPIFPRYFLRKLARMQQELCMEVKLGLATHFMLTEIKHDDTLSRSGSLPYTIDKLSQKPNSAQKMDIKTIFTFFLNEDEQSAEKFVLEHYDEKVMAGSLDGLLLSKPLRTLSFR